MKLVTMARWVYTISTMHDAQDGTDQQYEAYSSKSLLKCRPENEFHQTFFDGGIGQVAVEAYVGSHLLEMRCSFIGVRWSGGINRVVWFLVAVFADKPLQFFCGSGAPDQAAIQTRERVSAEFSAAKK